MGKLIKFLAPAIGAIIATTIGKKIFPKKKKVSIAVRGGDNNEITEVISKTVLDRLSLLMEDGPLKMGIAVAFGIFMVQNFNEEIVLLLSSKVLKRVAKKQNTGTLKIVCDIIQEYDLDLHSEEINELLINKYLTYSDKTNLLKIKLDYIINGQCYGKKRFIIQTLIAVLLGLVMTGMGPVSISLFLNALLMLFREGKISRALYLQLMKAILAGKIPVPLDELEQFVE